MPVTITEVIAPRKKFICSDGRWYFKSRKAFKHEMYLRIPTLLPQNAICYSKTFRSKRYHLCRHMFLECGIYPITLKDKEDLYTMNHFFRGLKDSLDYPEENDYPVEFNLEIFYEDIPGTLMDSAQWRLYGDVKYNGKTKEERENGQQ